MDSNCTEINVSELIMTRVGRAWLLSASAASPFSAASVLVASPLGLIQRPRAERRTDLGFAGIAECVAEPQVGKKFNTKHQSDVMGSNYAAADIFDARWESRPGRPPE